VPCPWAERRVRSRLGTRPQHQPQASGRQPLRHAPCGIMSSARKRAKASPHMNCRLPSTSTAATWLRVGGLAGAHGLPGRAQQRKQTQTQYCDERELLRCTSAEKPENQPCV